MNRVAKIAIALLLLVAGSAALNLDNEAEAGRRCRRGGCGSGCYSSSCSTGACEVAIPAPPPGPPPAPVCSSCGPAGCDTGYCGYSYGRCGRGRCCCR